MIHLMFTVSWDANVYLSRMTVNVSMCVAWRAGMRLATKATPTLVVDNLYGLPTSWQAGRSISLKFKFVFF